MALIKGSQLASVGKLFDLSQQAMRGATDIDVENVSQVLGINEIVRRSNAGGALATGLFVGVMQNVHGAGATELESTIDPYNVTLDNAGPGYPSSIDDRFDIWILEITGRRSSLTGSNFLDGQFNLDDPTLHRAFGVDAAGAAVDASSIRTLAKFVTINEDLATSDPLLGVNGETAFRPDQRIRRGTTFSWGTSASNAVGVRCQILMGLFPAGLGQDVVT